MANPEALCSLTCSNRLCKSRATITSICTPSKACDNLLTSRGGSFWPRAKGFFNDLNEETREENRSKHFRLISTVAKHTHKHKHFRFSCPFTYAYSKWGQYYRNECVVVLLYMFLCLCCYLFLLNTSALYLNYISKCSDRDVREWHLQPNKTGAISEVYISSEGVYDMVW